MKFIDVKDFFKRKKITLMGLGLLGRGVGDAKFFAKCGADLLVTDLKNKKELSVSISKLRGFKNIKFILGEHRFEDFRNRDLIIKSAGVPIDSPFIKEAEKNNTPVKMSTSLFVKLTEGKVVGVTGTRGKSTVTHLIHYILNKSGRKSFLGGNIRGLSTISLLEKIKKGDFVVLELDSWQLQGFAEEKISPEISVFTSFMPDHLNYYKGNLKRYFEDKTNIFKFQKKGDYFITTKELFSVIKNKKYKINSKTLLSEMEDIPNWNQFKIFGEHNKQNVLLAISACEVLGVKRKDALSIAKSFRGVPGRMEHVRTFKEIKFFNDTTATTPESSIAGLKALNEKFGKKVIAIMGGQDKGIETSFFVEDIHRYLKSVIFLPGTGTDKIKEKIFLDKRLNVLESENLNKAFKKALKLAEKGDILVLSPAFASFGLFKNEFDRGDKFKKLVNSLV